jgi:hypothetical protein
VDRGLEGGDAVASHGRVPAVRSGGLRWPLALLLLAAAISMALATASAQTSAEGDLTCIGCHRPKDTVIDPVRFGASVHGRLGCTTCHADGFSTVPHAATRAAAPGCPECHDFDAIVRAVKQSVHAQRVDPAFRCTLCHSAHYFLPAARLADAALAVRGANGACLGCHAKGESDRQRQAALDRLARRHRFVPHWELHLEAAPCVACHTGADDRTLHLIRPAAQAVRECAACHARTSMLVTKLYEYRARRERAEWGWLNSVLFNNAYVVGATRNRWLDWATLSLTAVLVAGLAMHGGGRWLCARWRRRS